MHRTAQDADRRASQFTETAARIAQEYHGRRADYLAEIERATQEIQALPISDATKSALIAQNQIIDRQVLSTI